MKRKLAFRIVLAASLVAVIAAYVSGGSLSALIVAACGMQMVAVVWPSGGFSGDIIAWRPLGGR